MPQGIRRKTYQEDEAVVAPLVSESPTGPSPSTKDESWVGTVKNFVWSLWSRILSTLFYFYLLENDENASEDSKSDANLSEYEERIRRNRDLPTIPTTNPEYSASPAVQIPSRRAAKPNSPILSPRNASPYLTDGDYGIKLNFPNTLKSDELLMTSELISKVHVFVVNEDLLTALASQWSSFKMENSYRLGTVVQH